MDSPTILFSDRNRYIPETDTIEYNGNPIILMHEMGHRDGIMQGLIKAVLVTHSDEVEAEVYAWKYAAMELRRQGLWNQEAKDTAKKGLMAHGIPNWLGGDQQQAIVEGL